MELYKIFTIEEHGNISFSQNIIDLTKEDNIKKLISFIQDTNPSQLVDSNNVTLLHLAAMYNNDDLARYLIEMQSNVNAESAFKITPLMEAAMNSSFPTAEVLIKAGADMYATNSSNESVIELLLNNKDVPKYIVNYCLKEVKSHSYNDKEIAKNLFTVKCPLSFVTYLDKPHITKMVVNRYITELSHPDVQIDISEPGAISFLREMHPWKHANDACLPLISLFLEKVTDWNALREEDLHCFESFFQRGSKRMIELFLQLRINEFVNNKFPEKDLLINIYENNNADVRELVTHLKINVHAQNSVGFTALHYAVRRAEFFDNVQTLLDLGADPNAKNEYESTPLYFVHYDERQNDSPQIKSNKRKMVELLLLSGADPQLDMRDEYDLWYQDPITIERKMMIAQLAIDESLGKPIKETILQKISDREPLNDIFEGCCQQLEKLKSESVHGSITLYHVLVMDPEQIANRLHNPEALQAIKEIVLSRDIYYYYIYYISKLKNSVNQILHAMDLRIKASKFICEITGWPSSQYIVIENISNFLTYKDLRVFDKLASR